MRELVEGDHIVFDIGPREREDSAPVFLCPDYSYQAEIR